MWTRIFILLLQQKTTFVVNLLVNSSECINSANQKRSQLSLHIIYTTILKKCIFRMYIYSFDILCVPFQNNHTQCAIQFCCILFTCNAKEIVCEQFLRIVNYEEASFAGNSQFYGDRVITYKPTVLCSIKNRTIKMQSQEVYEMHKDIP